MRTSKVSFSRWLSLAWPAAIGIAGVSVVGSAGWLWFFSADDASRRAVSLGVVLALAVLLALTWYVSRIRADKRWRGALDRYVEQEQTKRTWSRRNFHAGPQSRAR
jgi:hypothetical protein